MASKIIFFCATMAAFNVAYSQVIGRINGCGCSNILPVGEKIIGTPYLPPYLPAPACIPPSPVIYDQPTTIIQDSTVANNLANALQLLVVSNLLSSTLPLDQRSIALPASLAPIEYIPNMAPVELLPTANLAPVELLPAANLAPLGLSPSIVAPCSPCGCGCGGFGCNNCGFGPFNVLY